jgi:hypothetical protein
MTSDELEVILKQAQTKSDKEGFASTPEGVTLTLHAAHNGGSISVGRVDGVKISGEVVIARTAKRETTYAVLRSDLFAVAIEGGSSAPPRRAGFGT